MYEFVDYLHEVFELFGPIRARKMFSGYCIYHNGLMFGLVAGDTLYLKADAENANHFEKEGLGRFEHRNGERVVKMSYCRAPAGIMEDQEEAAIWARRSFEAAFPTIKEQDHTKFMRQRPNDSIQGAASVSIPGKAFSKRPNANKVVLI